MRPTLHIFLLRLGSVSKSLALMSATRYHTGTSILRSYTNTSINNNNNRNNNHLFSLISSGDSATATTESNGEILNKSTLILLEHINLNVPNHDYILEFYFNILGMGLDPRRAENVMKGSGTVWANCGASQFHLPHGDVPQVIPGSIGLIYDDLNGLMERLNSYEDNDDQNKPFREYSVEDKDDEGFIQCIRIVDRYDNVFYCRLRGTSSLDKNQIVYVAKQPIVYSDKDEHIQEYQDVASKYGLLQGQETECKGISYVEFNIQKGINKIEDIAEFYDCVFDAPTNVITDPRDGNKIAIIGFGSIDPETGRASQSLLFREKYENSEDAPAYDGHHIAFYVGENWADFEKAFENAMEAGVVWVNPRFSDKVTNINTAKKWKQFRFKDVLSLEKGRKVFELEHEVRSVDHDAMLRDY